MQTAYTYRAIFTCKPHSRAELHSHSRASRDTRALKIYFLRAVRASEGRTSCSPYVRVPGAKK
jgi:hypothetical protein